MKTQSSVWTWTLDFDLGFVKIYAVELVLGSFLGFGRRTELIWGMVRCAAFQGGTGLERLFLILLESREQIQQFESCESRPQNHFWIIS